ncbi:MAG: hypothetical protein A2Y33_00760 [Spirochaetes bacterium GWF1_51_8]|nr:MAG: hypothetical protein A2Y33_00760 [Spirochaetes bacterium GWF1_51_8]
MKNIIKIILPLLVLSGCGFVSSQKIDLNSFPESMNVDKTAQNFTEKALKFTGEPSADFGTAYAVGTDDTGDFSPISADIEKVYVAFSSKYLFIGHKTTSKGSGYFFDRGAFYIFIDNGFTNAAINAACAKGISQVNANGLTGAGISGNFRFLDDVGIKCNLPHKFTAFVKNYRTPFYSGGADFVIYNFTSTTLAYELIRGSVQTVGWANYLEENVTEVAIPWEYLFPGLPANQLPKTLHIAFQVNDAAANKYFSGSDWMPSAQDIAPDPDVITNWIPITISTNNL